MTTRLNWSRLPSGASGSATLVLGPRGGVRGVALTTAEGRTATTWTARPSLDHLDAMAAELGLLISLDVRRGFA